MDIFPQLLFFLVFSDFLINPLVALNLHFRGAPPAYLQVLLVGPPEGVPYLDCPPGKLLPDHGGVGLGNGQDTPHELLANQ